jgi:hypothetical protein
MIWPESANTLAYDSSSSFVLAMSVSTASYVFGRYVESLRESP